MCRTDRFRRSATVCLLYLLLILSFEVLVYVIKFFPDGMRQAFWRQFKKNGGIVFCLTVLYMN